MFFASILVGRSGFVLIEAAFFRKIVISNNCPNGPKEFFKELDYPLVSNNFKDESEFSEKIKSFLNNEKILKSLN